MKILFRNTISTLAILLCLQSSLFADNDDAFRSAEVRVTGALVPIFDSEQLRIQLTQADPLVKADQARTQYGYTGSGYSVAIIDTGVDYTHAALGGGFGSGFRVVAGYDFVNNDSNPMDDNGHGTHVAGIAAGNNSTYKGIAPDANIIALKVLGADGSGSYAAVESALQWIIANRSTYNIVSINMSLGSGNYTSNPSALLENEFSTLVASGVTICVSSGNSFFTYSSVQGRAYPSTSSNVISVGASWDGNNGGVSWGSGARDFTSAANRLTSFMQRDSGLSILAPGALITAAYLGGGFGTLAGTSMASPIVAGAAVLMHQALVDRGRSDLATQARILQFFTDNGPSVNDGDDEDDNVTNTNNNYKTIDILAAMTDLDAVAPVTTPTATPTATQTPTTTPTVLPPTSTPTPSSTATNSPTGTPIPGETPASTPIATSTPEPPSATPTPEVTVPSQSLRTIITEIQQNVQSISGSQNGEDDAALRTLQESLNALENYLSSQSGINRLVFKRAIFILNQSDRLIGLAEKRGKNKRLKRALQITIRVKKSQLLKYIRDTLTLNI